MGLTVAPALSPEDEAFLAHLEASNGLGQLQAPAPMTAPLGPEPGLLPPGQFQRAPQAPPPAAPMDLGAMGAAGPAPAPAAPPMAPAPIPPSGVSPAQPAGAVPAMKGLFADKQEILARLGDMFDGWAMGAGGTWQDSIAAGGKMVATGKLTRKEKKELEGSVNKTAEWAVANGIDRAVAEQYVAVKDAKGLIALTQDHIKAASNAGKADYVVIGDKLVDRNNPQNIHDFGDKEADGPYVDIIPPEEVARLGLDPSRPYQRDRKTGKIDPIGSSGQTIQVGSKLTETQSKDISFVNRGSKAFENMDKSFSVLADAANKYGGSLPVIGNYLKTPEYQRAEQAAREVLAVILRKDTGAAITKEEMEQYGSTFLPQPGDDATTIEQKRQAAKNTLDALYTGLGSLGPEYAPDYKVGLPPKPGAPGEQPSAPPPAGVDPDLWQFMTPEERALWQ